MCVPAFAYFGLSEFGLSERKGSEQSLFNWSQSSNRRQFCCLPIIVTIQSTASLAPSPEKMPPKQATEMKRTPNPRNNPMRWKNLFSYSVGDPRNRAAPEKPRRKWEEGEHRNWSRTIFQDWEKAREAFLRSFRRMIVLPPRNDNMINCSNGYN